MPAILTDLRRAMLSFRRKPAFAAALVVTLALGIAPNCVIFAIMDAMYFRPLPYPGQERLALLNVSHPSKATIDTVDAFTFSEWKRGATAFESMAAYRNAPLSLNWNDQPERVPGQAVSGDFFRVLAVPPLLGRALETSDTRPGAPAVIVVSHRTWQDYFSGRPDVVGLAVRVNGTPSTVVGVMPPDFVSFMEGRPARAWVPMPVAPAGGPSSEVAGNVLARLAPAASLDSVRATLQSVHAAIAAQHPGFYRDRAALVRDFRASLFGGLGPGIRMLSVLVGLVLFIACGNAANLLLARAVQRRREVAVRRALGARRWQLARALMVESFGLALAGAAVGAVSAYWTIGFVWARTAPIFRAVGVDRLAFDGRVLGFAALLAVGVTVMFGILPAVRESGVDLIEALKEGTTGAGRGGRRRSMSRVLVVAQVALCVVTMIAATLVVRSVAHFARLAANPGFRPGALVVATLPAPSAPSASPNEHAAALEDIHRRVAGIVGVESVALTDRVPFLDGAEKVEVATAGGPEVPAEAGERFDVGLRAVDGSFFPVMSMPLLRGRLFAPTDGALSLPVAVATERLVAARWKGRDPLGDQVFVGGSRRTVVGVVASSVQPTPFRSDPGELFVPWTQTAVGDMKLLVRSDRDVAELAVAMRAAVQAVDRDQPIAGLRTMEGALSEFMTPFRLILGLTVAFSAIALMLAAVGLYGVIAHSVAARTREMGVRMALGAERADVVRLVVREGLRLGLAGLAVGLLPGLALVKILPSALFGVGGLPALHLAAAAALWLGVALGASLLPARRAARVQPMAALRWE